MSTPRIVVTGTVTGLLLMSFFTMAWAANTFSGWPTAAAAAVFGLAVAAASLFVITAVRLLRARKTFSGELSPEETQFRKRSGRTFGLVFGAEAVAIWVASLVLTNLGLDRYVVPTIALIVGLHFYPMARVFRRTVDLYLATWTSLVGIAGIVALGSTNSTGQVTAFVGLGAALATTAYGIYMSRLAFRLLSSTPRAGRRAG
jgi:hypothetical protein